MTIPPAGWYQDPTKRHEVRYWDGARWTDHVSTQGVSGLDPLVVPTVPAEPAETAAEVSAATNPVRKVGLFGAKKKATALIEENENLQRLIARFGIEDVAARDAERARLEKEIESSLSVLTQHETEAKRVYSEHLAKAERLRAEHEAKSEQFRAEQAQLEQTLINMRLESEVQEFGLYDFENPAESSVAVATQLEAVRTEIKRAVRGGYAATATANFTFNNSAAKGRKFVRDMTKLMLRAYNSEAENCVKGVKAGNLAIAQKRLSTVVTQVERLGSMIDLQITSQYHALRLSELELTNRHLRALQVEKEMERARREELREQKKAEQELARERERLEKERSHYLNALAALESKGDVEGAERLREKLSDVDRAIVDVDYRRANVRAGYVYVISNVGSFGPDVVKIGLTRRLEPMDRVNELGDASVPFRFDVHALFFADDAVGIESMLHKHFADRRLNKVNLRREYFRATPQEVLGALQEHSVEVLEFRLEPEAAEYRGSVIQMASERP